MSEELYKYEKNFKWLVAELRKLIENWEGLIDHYDNEVETIMDSIISAANMAEEVKLRIKRAQYYERRATIDEIRARLVGRLAQVGE